MECIATFDTAHMAIMFEKTCRGAGHSVRIVPVPRNLSSSCGLACRYPCTDHSQIEELAKSKQIDVEEYHRVEG